MRYSWITGLSSHLCLMSFVVIQLLSHIWLFVTPWTAPHQAFLSSTISWSFLKHFHWISDAIQPSHPLLSPSSPAFNLSQHQGLFKWVGSLHQMAKVSELQHQSFQWVLRTDLLEDGQVGVQGTLKSPPTPQFKSINSSTQFSLQSNSHIHT